MTSEFGKRRSGLPSGDLPEFKNQQDQEPEDGKHSNLDPRNQFSPRLRLFPRPRITGISVGIRIPLEGLIRRLFSRKARQERRLKKAVERWEHNKNRVRSRK